MSAMPHRSTSPAVSIPHAAQPPFQPPVPPPKLSRLVKRESKPLAIVDPKAKLATPESATAESSGTSGSGQKPRKHAIAIVDPKSKQALPLPADAASGSPLANSDSANSAATNIDKPAKRLISIVDPNNKLPVELPVKPLGNSRLARTNSNISAASSDSNQPAKRMIAILDPQNKQPIVLPDKVGQARQSSITADVKQVPSLLSGSGGMRRAKMPIAIVDPATSAEVRLPMPSVTSSSNAGKVAAPRQVPVRLVRARKPLAIVEPRAKANSASTSSAQAAGLALSAAERAAAVSLRFRVADDGTVRCLLIVGVQNWQLPGDSGNSADKVVLKLTVDAADTVMCSITSASECVAAGKVSLIISTVLYVYLHALLQILTACCLSCLAIM